MEDLVHQPRIDVIGLLAGELINGRGYSFKCVRYGVDPGSFRILTR